MKEHFILNPQDNYFVYLQKDIKKEKLYLLSVFNCLFSQGIGVDDNELVKLTDSIKKLTHKQNYIEKGATYHYYEVPCFYYYTEENQVFDKQNAYHYLDDIKIHCAQLFEINSLCNQLLNYKEKYAQQINAITVEKLHEFILPIDLTNIMLKRGYYNQKAGPFGNPLEPYVQKWKLILDDKYQPLSIKHCNLLDEFSQANNLVLFIEYQNINGYVQIEYDDEGATHCNLVSLENATHFSSIKKVNEVLRWVNYDNMTICETQVRVNQKIQPTKDKKNNGENPIIEKVFSLQEKNRLESNLSNEQLAQQLMDNLSFEQSELKAQLQKFLENQQLKQQNNYKKMKI